MKKSLLRYCISKSILRRRRGKLYNRQKSFHISYIIQDSIVLAEATNNAAKGSYWAQRLYPEHSKEHSEVAAYRKAFRRIDTSRDFEIINIRVMANGTIGIAKPCDYCYKILKLLGCSVVYYSNIEGSISKEKIK